MFGNLLQLFLALLVSRKGTIGVRRPAESEEHRHVCYFVVVGDVLRCEECRRVVKAEELEELNKKEGGDGRDASLFAV